MGGLWAWVISGNLFDLKIPGGYFVAICAEASYTFLIVAVALMVQAKHDSVTAVAVPLAYIGSITACRKASLGIFNPAVAIGINMLNLFYGRSITNIFAYIIGPCIGGLLAALANIFVENAGKKPEEKSV